eukprot:sb/3463171/
MDIAEYGAMKLPGGCHGNGDLDNHSEDLYGTVNGLTNGVNGDHVEKDSTDKYEEDDHDGAADLEEEEDIYSTVNKEEKEVEKEEGDEVDDIYGDMSAPRKNEEEDIYGDMSAPRKVSCTPSVDTGMDDAKLFISSYAPEAVIAFDMLPRDSISENVYTPEKGDQLEDPTFSEDVLPSALENLDEGSIVQTSQKDYHHEEPDYTRVDDDDDDTIGDGESVAAEEEKEKTGSQSVGWDGHSEIQTFFTEYVDLVHSDEGQSDFVFKFTYQFPPDLPSSFRFVSPEEDVRACIEYAFLLVDLHENQIIAKDFIVLCEAPPYNYQCQPRSERIKLYYFTCLPRGSVTLTAETDRSCYSFGDTVNIRCSLSEGAANEIGVISVILGRYISLKDGNFHENNMRHVLQIEKYKDADAGKEKKFETVLPFTITSADLQSVSKSQFINCKYLIRVSTRLNNGFDLFVDLDITLIEVSQKTLRRADESMAKFTTSPKPAAVPAVSIKLAKKASISSSSSSSSSSDNSTGRRPPCERDNTIDDGETLPDDGAVDEDIPQTIVVRNNSSEGEEDEGTLHETSENVTPSLPKFPDDYLPDNESGSQDIEERDIIVEL